MSAPAAARLLALALTGAATGALLLPPLAASAAPVPQGTTTGVLREARVEPLADTCGVRVTLRPGVGPRDVVVAVRTVAPTEPADQAVPLPEEGQWQADAGESRDWAFSVDARAGDPRGHRVEVAVTVNGRVTEETLLWLDRCVTAPSPSPTAVPTASPSPSPSVQPSGSASPRPAASPSTSPGAAPVGTGSASPPAAPSASPSTAPSTPAATGGTGTASAPLLLGGPALVAAPQSAPQPPALVAPQSAQLPALLAPQVAAPPAPQVAAGAPLLFPLPVPSEQEQPLAGALPLAAPADPRAGALADLLPAGTALALAVLALSGLVRRQAPRRR